MATLKDTVREVGQLLSKHELGPELHELWHSIQWNEAVGENKDGVALSPANEPLIHLYPNLSKNPDAGRAVLREFGEFILARSMERGQNIWAKKLCVPEQGMVDEYAAKLADPELRKSAHTYAEIVQSYPTTNHAVNRLVAVHLSNALIANNVAFASTQGLDIRQWGPTTDYARLKKYHSLIPLTSAYCPKEIHESFGAAFADLIIGNLKTARDESVNYALKAIIRNIVKRATG